MGDGRRGSRSVHASTSARTSLSELSDAARNLQLAVFFCSSELPQHRVLSLYLYVERDGSKSDRRPRSVVTLKFASFGRRIYNRIVEKQPVTRPSGSATNSISSMGRQVRMLLRTKGSLHVRAA